jgi:hypothetical protein
MALPGYTADATLYKTMRSYRRHSSASGFSSTPIIVAQDLGSCTALCAVRWQISNALCSSSIGVPPLFVLCLAGAGIAFGLCLDSCTKSNPLPPNPDPPPQGCCPSGQRCCGSCESGRCDDVCVGAGQACP